MLIRPNIGYVTWFLFLFSQCQFFQLTSVLRAYFHGSFLVLIVVFLVEGGLFGLYSQAARLQSMMAKSSVLTWRDGQDAPLMGWSKHRFKVRGVLRIPKGCRLNMVKLWSSYLFKSIVLTLIGICFACVFSSCRVFICFVHVGITKMWCKPTRQNHHSKEIPQICGSTEPCCWLRSCVSH